MVSGDSRRRRGNLNMAWIDVKKDYDSIEHRWLVEMMSVHGCVLDAEINRVLQTI